MTQHRLQFDDQRIAALNDKSRTENNAAQTAA